MKKIRKRSILMLLSVALIAVLTASCLIGCGQKDPVVESIEVDASAAAVLFGEGEQFDSYGLKVTATDTDGNKWQVKPSDCSFTVPDMSTAGEKTVKVTYQGKNAEYKITVVKVVVTAINLDTAKVKTEYVVGDTFTADGLTVTTVLNHGNGSKVHLSDCTFSGYDMSKTGRQTVTVSYSGQTATYEINVSALQASHLEFDLKDVKLVYAVGDTVTTENLKAEVVMNNGDRQSVEYSALKFSSVDTSSAGNKPVSVTVDYGGKDVTSEYTVVVLPKRAEDYGAQYTRSFTNADADGNTLTLYVERTGGGSDKIASDTKGWYLLRRKDASVKAFSFACKYNPADWSTKFDGTDSETNTQINEGELAVGEYYQYLQATVEGTRFVMETRLWHHIVLGWNEVDKIEVDASAAKTTFVVGDTFDYDGISVIAERFDGSKAALDSDEFASKITVEAPAMNAVGIKTVTVRYGDIDYADITTTYEIEVIALAVTSIEIDSSAAKTVYFEGEEFTASGLIVTAVYNNGTRGVLSVGEYEVEAPSEMSVGTHSVTVKVGEITETYNVEVKESIGGNIESVSLDTSSVRTKYLCGDEFDAAGLTVTVNFKDGSTENVPLNACTFSGYDMSEAGEQTVTVTYAGHSGTYRITVSALVASRFELDHSELEKVIAVGTEFDASALKVKLVMTTGEKYDVELSGLTLGSVDTTDAGNKTLTVSGTFGGKNISASLNIVVLPKAVSDYGTAYSQEMENGTANGVILTLYVERTGGGLNTVDASVNGYYVLTRPDLTVQSFVFTCRYTAAQWNTNFDGTDTATSTAIKDNDLQAIVEGTVFTMEMRLWHYIVLGWNEEKSIEVDASGAKKEFVIGVPFDYDGIVVTVTMFDGTTKVLNETEMAEKVTVVAPSTDTLGVKEVIVRYGDVNYVDIHDTYEIEVVDLPIVSIDVDTSGVKTVYFENDTFSYVGLKVIAVYSNGDRKQISLDEVDVTEPSLDVAGEKSVVVTLKDSEIFTEYTVTVREPLTVEISSIGISGTANKKVYWSGESLDLSGLRVTVNYADGTSETIDLANCEITSPDMSEVGVKQVTVSYGGKEASFEIAVVASGLSNSVLHFTNNGGTEETLTLYVATNNESGNGASGYYVFTAADGKMTLLRFSYHLVNGWESRFESSQFGEGVSEAQVEPDYEVTYNGLTFRSVENWRGPLLGWAT